MQVSGQGPRLTQRLLQRLCAARATGAGRRCQPHELVLGQLELKPGRGCKRGCQAADRGGSTGKVAAEQLGAQLLLWLRRLRHADVREVCVEAAQQEGHRARKVAIDSKGPCRRTVPSQRAAMKLEARRSSSPSGDDMAASAQGAPLCQGALLLASKGPLAR